jgi:hypothetical protein
MELASAPGIGCFVPQLPPDPPDVTVLCGICGFGVRKWWRRRESNRSTCPISNNSKTLVGSVGYADYPLPPRRYATGTRQPLGGDWPQDLVVYTDGIDHKEAP